MFAEILWLSAPTAPVVCACMTFTGRLNNGNWSTPVNFGASINSESNEFMAIADYTHEFENQFFIRSSDRPGCKGRYDLYYVGIDVMPSL
jgi:hypothetical protein